MKKVIQQWLWLVTIWGSSVLTLSVLGYLIKLVLA